MSRFSSKSPTNIEFSMWLALNENGAAKMTRGEPSLSPRERAMHIRVNVPRSVFKTPTIKASVNVPDVGKDSHGNIDAAVDLVSETLKGVFGGEINVVIGDSE